MYEYKYKHIIDTDTLSIIIRADKPKLHEVTRFEIYTAEAEVEEIGAAALDLNDERTIRFLTFFVDKQILKAADDQFAYITG